MIMNEARYEAAKQARIRNNRRTGARRRWLDANPNAERAENFLLGCGEFDPIPYTDQYGEERTHIHPLRKAAFGDFFSKMADTLVEWGALTEKQTDAVIGMIDRAEKRIAEREAAKAEQAATCHHIGTVGERREISGTIYFVTGYDTQFGYTTVTGIKDEAGNIIIQKGVPVGEKGEQVRLKATIKEHAVRDGIAQTIISRPKKM